MRCKWTEGLLVLCMGVVLLHAAYTQTVRKYSNEFLAIGIGARSLAMGNAAIVSSPDATAVYWNPAGILEIKSDAQLSLMHAEYFAGLAKYDFGGVVIPTDSSSAIGAGLIRFGVDDIPNTLYLVDANGNINYDRIQSFSVADYAFLFSYARKLPIEGLSLGGNVKIIYRRVGDFAHAWGFGLDAAVKYQVRQWTLAAVARDVTSTFNAWTYTLSQDVVDVFTITGNEIPQNGLELTLPRVILGATREYKVGRKGNFSLMPEVNAELTFDKMRNTLIKSDPISIDPRAGIECSYKKIVFLRVGVMNFQHYQDIYNFKKLSFQPNIGLGVNIKNFIFLDYAYTDIGNVSIALYSHVVSLSVNLNKNGKKTTQI